MGKGKNVSKSPRKKKGGLGAGGKSLDLDRPMGEGLGESVEPPPAPPPAGMGAEKPPVPRRDVPPDAPARKVAVETLAPAGKPPVPARDAPPEASEDEETAEEPAAQPGVEHSEEPVDEEPTALEEAAGSEGLAEERAAEAAAIAAAANPPQSLGSKQFMFELLPWVVKKQLAIETDREDLDFEMIFWVEGKSDRLMVEGHRSDFGNVYVVGPETPGGCLKRYRDSEFSKTPLEEVFETYRKHFVSILVRTKGFEIEFSDMEDFLEWAKY